MKVIWLGQNGLLFVSGKNKILVDPYLTDSLHEIDVRMERGWSINKKFHTVEPDVIVLTNSHLDHTDLSTLRMFIEKNKRQVTLLCCESAFNIIASSGIIGRYNNVLMESGSEWTHDNLIFEAVPAKTDDRTAIGIIITDGTDGKKYYVTSDTLYNKSIFRHVGGRIDTLFLPINGEDGGMNMDDAIRFAERIEAAHTVPVHFGMFDDVNPRKFKMDGAVIPVIYKIIPLDDSTASECSRLSLRKLFAAEEREMKLKLSNKALRVEDSKIVPEEVKTEDNKKEPEVTEAEGGDYREEGHSVIIPVPVKPVNEVESDRAESEKAEAREKIIPIATNDNAAVCDKKSVTYEEISPISVQSAPAEQNSLQSDDVYQGESPEAPVEAEMTADEPSAEDAYADGEVIVVEEFTDSMEIDVAEPDRNAEDDVIVVEELAEGEYDNLNSDDEEEYEPYDDNEPYTDDEIPIIEEESELEETESEEAESEYEAEEESADDSYPELEEISELEEITDTQDESENDKELEFEYEPEADEAFDSEKEAEWENELDTEDDLPPFDVDEEEDDNGDANVSVYSDIWVDEDGSDEITELPEADLTPETEEITGEVYEIPDFDSAEDAYEAEEIDADSELIYSDDTEDKEAEADDEMAGFEAYDDGDVSDRIDAYVKELEKFERGDTVDFSKLEF